MRSIPPKERANALQRLINARPEIKKATPFIPSGRKLEQAAKQIRDSASANATEKLFDCPVCRLTFRILHVNSTRN